MSSPSSNASNNGKRKRSTPQKSTSLALDQLQPSSRDASAEGEGDGEIADSKPASLSISTQHAAKRLRSGTHTRNGEDGSEASMDENGAMKAPASQPASDTTTAMAPPPIGRSTDPVGYKTNIPPAGRKVRVYADGVFDLFHLGHMRQLEQAKKAFPNVYLLVGVTGDKETHKRKGLTVLSGQERAETVRHCKWVDEVIEDCPWIVTPGFLEEHEIDYVAHDDLPYGADEGDDIYKPIKEKGMFLVTQRTEGVSTTGIITKIVRDYEQYIARQFKRGTSRQELNVSWLKKNELDLKRHVSEIRSAIRSNWSTTGQELGKELRSFWQNSRPSSPARSGSYDGQLTSPSALQHLKNRLDIPSRPESPGAGSDFATGYSLGLIGGVRSWMTKSRQTNRDSVHASDSSEDDDKSPMRGRTGRADHGSSSQEQTAEKQVEEQMNAIMNENSKLSGT